MKYRNVVMVVGVLSLGLGACSTSRVNTLTMDNKLAEVAVSKVGVEGHYKAAGEVTAATTIKISIVNGLKTISGDDFEVTIDKDGGKQYREKLSKIYIGSTFPVVAATASSAGGGGMLSGLFGGFSSGAKIGTKTDQDYATDIANYQLIKKARAAGADAFLDSPHYEWEIKEDSEYKTMFWIFKTMTKYEVEYKVKVRAKTATLEYKSAAPKGGPETTTIKHIHTHNEGGK